MGATQGDGLPLELLDPAAVMRTAGHVALAGGALGALWLAITGAPGQALVPMLVFIAGTVVLAAGLHVVGARHATAAIRTGLVGAAALVTVGAATAGPTESPFVLFYVWLAPFAFLVWRPRTAAAFVALISLATTVLIGWHPGAGGPDARELAAWLIAVGGPLILGWVVARLTVRILERQARAEQAAERQAMVTSLARRAISETHVAGTVARAAAEMLAASLRDARVDVVVSGGTETVHASAGQAAPAAAEIGRFDIHAATTGYGAITVLSGAPLGAEDAELAESVADVLGVAAHRAARDREAQAAVGRDPVTLLPGRESFMRMLDRHVTRDDLPPHGALLLIDLNDFGLVNDALGPASGDRLLRDVADRLHDVLGEGRTLSRVGGDEFAVFDPAAGREPHAVELAKLVQRTLSEPFDIGGSAQHVTASIGVLVLPCSGVPDAQRALRDVHVAQRRATAQGRDRFVFFDSGMRQGIEQRRELEQDLRRALREQEFRLVYQPIVELATGRVTGVETLLRWERPGFGLVGPCAFMDVAEASDLIVPIGNWVLREALRQLKAWEATLPATGDFTLAVNLSGRQLVDPGFASTVARLVRSYEIDPRRVAFELTETALVDEGAEVERTMAELRRIGVGLALDDFGTGYASLRYVRRFPFDTLKLDRSFAQGRSPEDVALIRAAVAMGHALGLQVVGEGIEQPEQAEELRELGCELGQGFHFGRPVPAGGLRTVLRERVVGSAA